MRAREFLSEKRKEGKIPKRYQKSSMGLNTYSDAERWNADYVQYRLGIAAACTDGKIDPDMPAASWVGKHKTANPYTKQDQEILKKAYKAVGADYQDRNQGVMKSQELDSTYTVSPVANWQKSSRKK